MAKLNAPLFSFSASGKIANALVYFSWKGLNVARQYVVPANPDTTLQGYQRGYLKAAVAKIHDTQALDANPLDQEDQTAYAALGSTRKTPRTWFNEIVKLWLDVKVAVKVPCIHSDGRMQSKAAGSISVEVKLNEEGAGVMSDGKFYFGTSKTNLVNSKVAVVSGGATAYLSAVDCSAFLTAGKKYFWQFRPDSGDDCVGADSGIYHFVAE